MLAQFGFLAKPMSGRSLAIGIASVIFCLGLYCLAYNGLKGQPVTALSAFSWPVINVAPFLVAWDMSKRHDWSFRASAIIVACVVSLLLDFLYSTEFDLGFELLRRTPAVAIILCALLALDVAAVRSTINISPAELPLLPGQITRVTSSGNYVLLHTENSSVIHRAPLQSVEKTLAGHGFVRVHRTTLVRRDAISKVRPNDIVLKDGTSVKTGARFRQLLRAD